MSIFWQRWGFAVVASTGKINLMLEWFKVHIQGLGGVLYCVIYLYNACDTKSLNKLSTICNILYVFFVKGFMLIYFALMPDQNSRVDVEHFAPNWCPLIVPLVAVKVKIVLILFNLAVVLSIIILSVYNNIFGMSWIFLCIYVIVLLDTDSKNQQNYTNLEEVHLYDQSWEGKGG